MLEIISRLWRRALYYVKRDQFDSDLEEEMRLHLELKVEEKFASGMDADEARRDAQQEFGNQTLLREVSREMWAFRSVETLVQDVRLGLRALAKNFSFTFVVVLTLALGIGANTAIFSLINAVLLKPLNFRDPDRLVMLWEDASKIGFPRNNLSPADYADWKARTHAFEDLAAVTDGGFNLTGEGDPLRVQYQRVTANFFPLLGVKPLLGRAFLPEEDTPDGNHVVILSHSLWENRYGGDRGVLGQDILLSGEKYTCIGVMPPGFRFIEPYIGLWVPAGFSSQELAQRHTHYLTVFGRLNPGVTQAQAEKEVQAVGQAIATEDPSLIEMIGARLFSFRNEFTGDVRGPLFVLLIAVGFVLLIACANIASLLLSRAVNRGREIALRTALGATRWRIVRQLLTESALLAILGGLAGLVMARLSFAFLGQLVPPSIATESNLALDPSVLGFALGLSLLTGLICGLVPALQASRVDLNESLKQGGRGTLSSGSRRLQGAMVVVEIALALVLLAGAGLMIQTVAHLRGQYAGMRPQNLLTLRTALSWDSSAYKYSAYPRRAAFYDQVLERVKSLPGVVSAGYSTSVPLEWKGGTNGLTIEGRLPVPGISYDANHRQVSRQYLQTLGVALREGRYFDQSDNKQSTPAVIINEAMAREYWPNERALGKRFKVQDDDGWRTIVGIVADVRQMGLDAPVKPEMYFPYQQFTEQPWFAPRDLVIRSSAEPMSLVPAVRREIQAVDPDQPVSNIRTMEEILGEEAGPRRIGMDLLAAFAGLALLLASIGVYGVLAYSISRRTNEIGIRLALGARKANILGMVVGYGMKLALAGIAIGLMASFALTRLMKSLLFGVSATDPLTFAVITIVLAAVTLLACYIPARRAMKTDPMTALRYE
jgi:predicted permease